MSNLAAAQNTIAGFVKLQSSGRTPLPDVEVWAQGTQAVYTNDKGYFELKFNSKSAGDVVGYIEFNLAGYVIINEEKCQGIAIPKDPALAPLQIVMSPQQTLRQQKADYYGIIIENANTAYEDQNKKLLEKLAQLEKNSQENKAFAEERRILLQQIDNLYQEKEQAIANAEHYAQIFAQIDTDGASQLAADALKLFEAGKIKESIALMDDEQLRQNMKNAQAAKVEAESLIQRADSILQQSIENYMLKARLCAADLQFEAACQNYLNAIEGDSANLDNLWEAAKFCHDLNQQKSSHPVL